MANPKHVRLLQQGEEVWNKWRTQHLYTKIDLSRADLHGAFLSEANLKGANLRGIDLSDADLCEANLSGVDLSDAELSGANFLGADLSRADLSGVDLSEARLRMVNLAEADLSSVYLVEANLRGVNLGGANLSEADLRGANLRGAYFAKANFTKADLAEADLSDANLSGTNLSGTNLSRATLVGTNLTGATLTECHIHGISVWNVLLDRAKQENLIITDNDEPTITVDNLEVAQFIYLLLNNAKIRDVINTITTKVVLILGRFTRERKEVLDALRKTLRQQDYVPVLVDFEKPYSRNITETVSTLAHLARFIIADLSEPRSIPQELQAIIPLLRVPVQPLLYVSEEAYSMFEDLEDTYHWVLPPYHYLALEALLTSLKTNVIEPAEQKAQELEKR